MALATTNEATIASGACPGTAAFVPQLSRYSVVSVIALATDFGVYLSLCALAVNAPVAGVIGYAVGMIAHYALSSAFVFDVAHARKSAPRRLAEFAGSGLLGLVLTGFIIAALTTHFAASAIFAKAIAVVVSFLAVFLLRRWIVFAPASNANELETLHVYAKSVSSD
ncbi:MAG: GtrA family protein [Hyphomicrobium sp.]|uniref:GtrA family protein n=1 Tax=Hyphomicrobium sp. TaxID=82 RepID=UPI0039E64553